MACCVGVVLVFILHARIHLDKGKKWVQAITVETKGRKNESWQERHPPPAKSEGGNTKGASEV